MESMHLHPNINRSGPINWSKYIEAMRYLKNLMKDLINLNYNKEYSIDLVGVSYGLAILSVLFQYNQI